ncbi:MAG: hypothetical protein QOD63_2389 [Actinomycetota bacterium]|jgi:hypothetical protein|nr:hypothetical protein [Actinomycetota bacterium]
MSSDEQPEQFLRVRDRGLAWRLVEGEVVVLDLDRSEYLAVNHSGAALWTMLADGTTRSQLAGHLVERYGLDVAQAAADVHGFVVTLEDRHLLDAR